MNKKKILITGGTGFIGYHLSKKCIKLNWSVTSLSTTKPKKIRKLKKVNYKICDVSIYNQINKKIKSDYDYVVNLAGYVDHSHRVKTMKSHSKQGESIVWNSRCIRKYRNLVDSL